jgi:diguanylate cyclase (GGDEF)-like protein
MPLRLPFNMRLFLAMALTLCVSGALVVVVNAPHVKRALVDSALERHAGDAQMIEYALANPERGERPMDEVDEVIEMLQMRPGSIYVVLIDPRGRVIAGTQPEKLGKSYPGADARAALGGKARAGAGGTGSAEHLALFTPVHTPRGTYALHTDQHSSELQEAVSSARRQSAISVLIGLVVGVPLFYLLGGRTLSQSHRAAVERAARDPLTSLGNVATFKSEVDRAIRHADRDDEPVSLAIVDVDRFKELNDKQGHRHGDQVLRTVATILDRTRPGDRAFRTGGDEFAVLLPATSEVDALQVLERLQQHARRAGHGFTLSVGVATRTSTDIDGEELRELADAAMYRAKRRGGDAIVPASDRSSSGVGPVLTMI